MGKNLTWTPIHACKNKTNFPGFSLLEERVVYSPFCFLPCAVCETQGGMDRRTDVRTYIDSEQLPNCSLMNARNVMISALSRIFFCRVPATLKFETVLRLHVN
jgi:hypothetical protein